MLHVLNMVKSMLEHIQRGDFRFHLKGSNPSELKKRAVFSQMAPVGACAASRGCWSPAPPGTCVAASLLSPLLPLEKWFFLRTQESQTLASLPNVPAFFFPSPFSLCVCVCVYVMK